MITVQDIIKSYQKARRVLRYIGCSEKDIVPYLSEQVTSVNGEDSPQNISGYSVHTRLINWRHSLIVIPR